MPAEPQNPARIECRTAEGRLVAHLCIWPPSRSQALSGETHPLIRWTEGEAQDRGEEPVQLRERGRYIYRLEPEPGEPSNLRLAEERGITRSPATIGNNDAGFIEPGDQCGVLPLTIVRAADDTPVARVAVEVRSVKMDYREHYRGMLNYISDKCAGLLLDSRAPTRLRLSSEWRSNRAVMEQQLEFLRQELESATFHGAVAEVLRNPHRRLEDKREDRPVGRPFKAGKDFARQVSRTGDRVRLPPGHPLGRSQTSLASLPARISTTIRTDDLDTPENRFIKMVLGEFRDFLAEVTAFLSDDPRDAAKPENVRLLREVGRSHNMLDNLLSRGFFPTVSRPEILPLGSPTLQRKAGYRELLHLWLQFHVGAQIAWEGGQDVWQGGARNVATLYEYWLFFQLEAVFRNKFSCNEPLHSVLVEVDAGLPRLKLQRGIELKASAGRWSGETGRWLAAEFHFNRKFVRRTDHHLAGSWTRGVQPDYTISIWPVAFTKAEAEQNEAMVHIHFDAKYRVDVAQSIFGNEADGETIQDHAESAYTKPTAAKYADLLKMHAYRDAIYRTAGAYVLYPGNSGDGKQFEEFGGFHEVLPGLGAFALRPRLDGTAEGLDHLQEFLDDVIRHLANRTTARERTSYHVGESYMVRERPVQYGPLVLAEKDSFDSSRRAAPPAEHKVIVAWFDSEEQIRRMQTGGQAAICLSSHFRPWQVPPELSSVHHILLRASNGKNAPGLFRIRTAGYRVLAGKNLANDGYPVPNDDRPYAVFDVTDDPAYMNCEWDNSTLVPVLDEHGAPFTPESATTVHSTQILSLRELLSKAHIRT